MVYLPPKPRYSILSSTSNFIYGKLDALGYTTFAKDSRDEVERLTLSANEPDEDNDANPFDAPSSTKVSKKTADDKSIRYIKDFQLVLLRHWNLYDSLFHSTYAATKLGIWKEKGRQRLTNLLVKMSY